MVIAVGSKAPEFTLVSAHGEEVTLSDALTRGPVVLVFFPFAFSGICQGELCELRDNISMFADAGVQLMGVSVDSKFALRAWGEEQGYDFPLLADFWPHGAVAQAYDAWVEERGMANRATVLIDRDGIVRASFVTEPGAPRPLDAYREAVAAL
ncbi:MAG TPA: peroxiredoxin [Microbacteriaceae bacterium]|nr:peroxiredoxin [Microbacteriaceae bacterium]